MISAAGIMFVTPGGEVLLLRRVPEGNWAFPGGKLEEGEDARAAALRECGEEIGRYPNGDLVEWMRRVHDDVDYTTFLNQVPNTFEPMLNEEHDAWQWASIGRDLPFVQDDPDDPVEVVVVNDAEFEEHQHPRDAEGALANFPSAGGPSQQKQLSLAGSVRDVIKKKGGFEKQKGGPKLPPGVISYVNATTGVKVVRNNAGYWLSYKEGHEPRYGHGPTALKALLDKPPAQQVGGPSKDTPAEIPAPATPGSALQPDGKVNTASLKQVGPQLGSNKGGQFEDPTTGKRYYVKTTKSAAHAESEVTAANLYKLAGINTLGYRPSTDPTQVVTDLVELEKDSVMNFSKEEIKQVRLDFAVHAWLANWDVTGLSGDNLGIVDGKVTVLDTGGSLNYRAQGGEKGALFGSNVTEWDTLRDPKKNAMAVKIFEDMTTEELEESKKKVEAITPEMIMKAVPDKDLANKLIWRRGNLLQTKSTKSDVPTLAASTPESTPQETFSKLAVASPPKNDSTNHAITEYKGAGYER